MKHKTIDIFLYRIISQPKSEYRPIVTKGLRHEDPFAAFIKRQR